MASQYFVDEEFAKDHGSDDEVNDKEHGKLLRAMHLMDNQQRIKPPSRTEPSLNISEFHLPNIKGGGVQLKDLARSLDAKGKKYDAIVAEKIKVLNKKSRPLHKPLEKVEAQKIKRVVAYKNLTKHVGRWDAIVQTNRVARSVTFPMEIDPLHVPNTSEVVANWQTQASTDLEDGINKLLGISKVAEVDKKEEQEFRLTLAELREKRKELAKLRAQQSYEAAKAKRTKKIKSKKYHRILRRANMRKQLQEFETLKKTDPEAALKQLEQLEKTRAEERMTLRHKSTGKWARGRLMRAKYDPQTRQQLAEQLAKSRELTKKLKDGDSSDEDDKNDNETSANMKMFADDKDNPWITVKPRSEIKEFVSGYKKYWEEQNKKKAQLMEAEINSEGQQSTTNIPPELQSKSCNKHLHEGVVNDVKGATEQDKSLSYPQPAEDGEQPADISLVSHKTPNKRKNNSIVKKQMEENSEAGNLNKSDVTSNNALKKVRTISSSTKSKIKNENKHTPSERKKKTKILHMNGWEVTPVTIPKSVVSSESDNERPTVNNYAISEDQGSRSNLEAFLTSMKEMKETMEVKCDVKKKKKRKTAMDKIFEEAKHSNSEKVHEKFDKLKAKLEHYNFQSGVKDKQEKMKIEVNDLGASLALRNMRELRPTEDEELDEGSENPRHDSLEKLSSTAASINGIESSKGNAAKEKGSCVKPKDTDINPDKFIVAKPKVLLSAAPDIVTAGDEALDDEYEETQQTFITEAFADDDVVDSFRKEKEDEINKSKPQDIDLSLPGWGSWGGTGIVQSKRKRLRFMMKAPRAPPRKDANKLNVIIHEEVAKAIREHQVCELPAPFTSVKDFEASIRAPLGNTWIPQTAHQKLIEPAVISKMGKIIKPLNEEFLVNIKVLIPYK